MPAHHIRIAQRPQRLAKSFQRARQRLSPIVIDHRPQQVERRLQSPGRNPRLVNIAGFSLIDRRPHMGAEFLD
jgi:hypothetical protein